MNAEKVVLYPYFSELAEEILARGAYKVTEYVSDKLTIKATRKRYARFDARDVEKAPIEIVFTIGKPNYEEREKINRAKKLKQGPIKMTIQYPPKKK